MYFVVMLLGAPARAQTPPAPITLTPFVEQAVVAPGATVRLALQATLAPELHAQSNAPTDPAQKAMRLYLDAPAGVRYVDVAFPPPAKLQIAGFDEPSNVFGGTFLIGARIAIASTQPDGVLTIPGRLYYQACDDKLCYPPKTVATSWTITVDRTAAKAPRSPAAIFDRIDFRRAEPAPDEAEGQAGARTGGSPAPLAPVPGTADIAALLDRFELLGTAGGYLDAPDFVQFIRDAERGVKRKGMFEDRGPAAILALVFLGGLALNLTPCVLPMIPINLAIIGAGARSARRGRGFLLGSAYGAAMAVVYGVLGLAVILTAGTFGAINASFWFNAAIAVLFLVLGLAMFDLFAIDLSRWSSRIMFDPKSRGSLLLAFSMGAVAALLAGACVAPVVIQVVVFASDLYASGTAAALALPFVLGLGMALPWPLAGAGVASLPKPGPWMVRVKQALGVFILGTAVYYGYVAYGILSSRWVDPVSVRAGVEEQLKQGWYASPADGLQAALRDRTPVLVDFWATWCKNCLVMDKTTLQDPAVRSALAGYTRIKYQAEDPDAPPTKALLQRVGSVGLPTYVVLKPK